jgi:hypothetical protein
MNIKPTCRVHDKAPVYFLEGTASFVSEDGNVQGDDSQERSVELRLDVYNLYCTSEGSTHDLYFAVTEK